MDSDSRKIESLYKDVITGYDEPDAIWGNGKTILELRAGIGITDVNDSNGEPIDPDQCYCVTRGGVTLPVAIPDDPDDN